jgi:hypothetical protein
MGRRAAVRFSWMGLGIRLQQGKIYLLEPHQPAALAGCKPFGILLAGE